MTKYRYRTWSITITFASNCAGWTVRRSLKKKLTDADGATGGLTDSHLVTVGEGAALSVTRSWTPTQMGTLTDGKYLYDVELVNPSGVASQMPLDAAGSEVLEVTITTPPTLAYAVAT